MTQDELLELYCEEYPELGPADAQQLHDFYRKLNPIDWSKMASKEEMQALLDENAKNTSETSPQGIGLVEAIMQRHGLTRKQAEEQIKAFGG